jgi:hypothetical protein
MNQVRNLRRQRNAYKNDEDNNFGHGENGENGDDAGGDSDPRVFHHEPTIHGGVLAYDKSNFEVTRRLSAKARWRRILKWALLLATACLGFFFPTQSHACVLYAMAFLCGSLSRALFYLAMVLGFILVSMFLPRLLGLAMTYGLKPVVHGFPLRFEYLHLEPWLTWGKFHLRVKAEVRETEEKRERGERERERERERETRERRETEGGRKEDSEEKVCIDEELFPVLV